ncbi:osteoclast stimulatory transmembrane protein [Ochotona princeps]|uniref:osteoclast stimulatory transmembrane protein n=1 Tax=Ochotona princeps TaxID=9978 RepID=UPI0027154BA5|nr:osteoclast stimulatory transmembrane protein [Ochotona princeps]
MKTAWGVAERLVRTGCKFWLLGLCKVLAPLQAAWDAFSQPVPASCGQLLTQILLCGSLAVAVAGLAHHWLVTLLFYPVGPSAIVATMCGLLSFLILGLVHPVRCLFALSIPTLGTEQGRRLLLSYSAATLATAVVPNVLANVGAAGQVLRCVTEGSLESLLNTTYQLYAASKDLGSVGHAGSRGLTLEAQGSDSAFWLHMLRGTQQLLDDFSGLESLARRITLGIQRAVTGLFILGLLVDSAWYLHHYLTDLRFDNIYATRQLTHQLAQTGAMHLLSPAPSWLLWAVRPKLSQEELLRCVLRLGLLALLLVATAVTVATDHVAFLLAQVAVEWAQKLPPVPITLSVDYDAAYTILSFIPFLLDQRPPETPWYSTHRAYRWELRLTSSTCRLLPAQRPRVAGALAAGTLQVLAGCTVLLDAYARRLRHSTAAAFYAGQEAKRARYLHARLQRSYDRRRGQNLRPQPPSDS